MTLFLAFLSGFYFYYSDSLKNTLAFFFVTSFFTTIEVAFKIETPLAGFYFMILG
jgi:hypothetical protein